MGILDLADYLGYRSPQKLYRLFNTDGASPSCQIIEDISDKLDDLNLNWLFTGRGEMVLVKDNIDYREKYLACMEEKERLYQKLIN